MQIFEFVFFKTKKLMHCKEVKVLQAVWYVVDVLMRLLC